MTTKKITLTELRSLVKNIVKEEQSKKKRVIKEEYDNFTLQNFIKELKDGPYAWPGGYPKYFVTKDGGVLSFDSAKEMKNEIIDAMKNNSDPSWYIMGVDINWEDPDLYCDHSGEKIECAYCDDETMQESFEPKTQKIKLSEVRSLVRKMIKEGKEETKKYEVTFEDVFDFSKTKKVVELTDSQLETAKKQKDNKTIVVNKFDPKTQTTWKLIIKSIKEI
jgi:hypothetical protein